MRKLSQQDLLVILGQMRNRSPRERTRAALKQVEEVCRDAHQARLALRETLALINDFMPHVRNCQLKNYHRLVHAPAAARKALVALGHTLPEGDPVELAEPA